MRVLAGTLILSPSDLANYLSCRHRAGLDLAVAHKQLTRPASTNPYAAILQKHGEEHEQAYVASLRLQGLNVVDAGASDPSDGLELTLEAMRAGADVIVQARLAATGFAGYADILRRVENESDLGSWSYEAHDTKLARETKGGTILQLSAYSDMLGCMQGFVPESFSVVTPAATEAYRVADYAAYYRMVRGSLTQEVEKGHERLIAEYYPEPVDACQVCVWAGRCEARRRKDDHLSYIAGSGRSHRVELIAQQVGTLTAAAKMPVPVVFKPARGARETYNRLGDQARVQHQQRTEKRPIVEMLPIAEGAGLRRLPEPSASDLFLDLEGAAFAREGGREYLFGAYGAYSADGAKGKGAEYRAWWALNDAGEKAAFEEVVDLIMTAWDADPGMHVYHFNHYEPTAFKKLAGRYVTRVEALDKLLRGERFIDLYPIVRQTVRAGVESYSIKQMEQYYGFTRQVALANVREPLMAVEMALENKAADAIAPEIRDAVQGYNEDDCRSTQALRDWLETLRSTAIAGGADVPRPEVEVKAPPEKTVALQLRAEAVRSRILASIPAEATGVAHPEHAQWLLAYLVDWHRREINAEWWEYFRLRDLPEEDLFDERKAVAGLQFVEHAGPFIGKNGKPTSSKVDRYRYPPQDIEIGEGDKLKLQVDAPFGEVLSHDRGRRTLDVKKGKATFDVHPAAAFAFDAFPTDVQQESVLRLAESDRPDRLETCGMQLLLGRAPRLHAQSFGRRAEESEQAFAIRIVTDLDRTTLAIQGPPGSGKTFIGAQMILALVRAGKKVAVTANSHKVIHNLLADVLKYARPGDGVKVAAKGDDDDGGAIRIIKGNEAPLQELQSGEVNVLGGTSWLWARPEYAAAVDVLFVDEAGQVSLATALAVSPAANSLVLLGDPQQLAQPAKASHPDGVGASALEHVLAAHPIMPPDRGIFLPITWRMSPTLTLFTSELFYEGKLTAKDGLDRQVLSGIEALAGSKLWLIPVDNDGCQSSSDAEVDAVVTLVEQLLAPGSMWINEKGEEKQLTGADIRIVAPFNAQVNRIAEALGKVRLKPDTTSGGTVQVGTVDKFQGQTCAVVIYSMATSRPEDAPRGMEFLYSLNRLNVATSRARCAVFLVASPRLFEPECRTPRQMQLANALCRYREMATLLNAWWSVPNHPKL